MASLSNQIRIVQLKNGNMVFQQRSPTFFDDSEEWLDIPIVDEAGHFLGVGLRNISRAKE